MNIFQHCTIYLETTRKTHHTLKWYFVALSLTLCICVCVHLNIFHLKAEEEMARSCVYANERVLNSRFIERCYHHFSSLYSTACFDSTVN